jgi:flavin reductase (DIM6/NTAB) family NADH-FMN oxidoreductase RutF
MELDACTADEGTLFAALSACLAPRPVAVLSSASARGAVNLAPFSSVMALSAWPPLVAVALHPRRCGRRKTTLRNIESTGEFVVSLVDPALLGGSPPRLVASVAVRPPRVAASAVQLECRLREILRPRDAPVALVIGEVLWIHADDTLLDRGALRPGRFRPPGHLGMAGRHTHLFAAAGETLRIGPRRWAPQAKGHRRAGRGAGSGRGR